MDFSMDMNTWYLLPTIAFKREDCPYALDPFTFYQVSFSFLCFDMSFTWEGLSD